MAKARAIVKRRKAVRNIRKITKTMQMIATAKFQKALKRAVAAKPYNRKVREMVGELAASVGGSVEHPLLRTVDPSTAKNRVALLVITSNRGLAGAYNGNILRTTMSFIRERKARQTQIDLYLSGKKGASYFNFHKYPITERYDQFADAPRFEDASKVADQLMARFIAGEVDAVHVGYMNFQSSAVQKAEVLTLLPLGGVVTAAAEKKQTAVYDFYPEERTLLDELLPLTVRTTLYQCFLDATTSENVARMVAMKAATDNADEMVKSLTMQYNRARQSQITTELSEIMGGVEAMKA
ncbi:MAG TPA: ATP synthase F1 subunit gamma [Tepidisphaeraceae bacterium]|nr:ATP synthase F1 subunit gamma [Tepidisphaeraceae bacterium]